MLTWNQNGRCYEGILSDGRKIDVDGDVFAETEQEMVKTCVSEGMSRIEAEQKVWTELSDPNTWQEDVDGVTVYKINQEVENLYE